jgi:hypothetical protein
MTASENRQQCGDRDAGFSTRFGSALQSGLHLPAPTIATIQFWDVPNLDASVQCVAQAAGMIRLPSVTWLVFVRTGFAQAVTYTVLAGIEDPGQLPAVALASDQLPGSHLIVVGTSDRRPSLADVLDAGADDYVTAPIDEHALAARLRAVERRRRVGFGSMRHGNLVLSPLTRTLECETCRVQLTPIEASLLAFFISRPERTISISEIAGTVWGNAFIGAPDPYKQVVGRLRRKLVNVGASAVIQTIWGRGYRLTDDASPRKA